MSLFKIDTQWEDMTGWGNRTSSFLNTLHPITANIVEKAVRVQHCYKIPIVQEFIKKADAYIRSLVEHTDKKFATFNIENYSSEDLARITDYVKKCTRSVRNYYQADNDDLQLNPLNCVDMSIGNLSDFLESIESTLIDKFSPLCMREEMRNDIWNILSCMEDAQHEEPTEKTQVTTVVDSVVIPDEEKLFENDMSVAPPSKLEHVESLICIQCVDEQSANELMRTLSKVNGKYILSASKDTVIITPSIFNSEHQLSIKMIRDALKPAESFLKAQGYNHTGSTKDEWGWLNAVWKI